MLGLSIAHISDDEGIIKVELMEEYSRINKISFG